MTKIVLIIEPDEYIRIAVKEILELENYHVLATASVTDGIELARQHLPHIVICGDDHTQPTNVTIIDGLQQEPTIRHIPIVMIIKRQGSFSSLWEKGEKPDEILTAPFHAEELITSIKILTGTRYT